MTREHAISSAEQAPIGLRVLFVHSREEPELTRTLAREGHDVLAVADDERPARWLEVFKPHLIVVAVRDPVRICCELRRQERDVPIIAIVHSQDVEERIAALQAGADDCIGRPFPRAELTARMRAAWRRTILRAPNSHLPEEPTQGRVA
jgi:DNA-binding response OmpR family regulator